MAGEVGYVGNWINIIMFAYESITSLRSKYVLNDRHHLHILSNTSLTFNAFTNTSCVNKGIKWW